MILVDYQHSTPWNKRELVPAGRWSVCGVEMLGYKTFCCHKLRSWLLGPFLASDNCIPCYPSLTAILSSTQILGATWPVATRVHSRGKKREDPGNEVEVNHDSTMYASRSSPVLWLAKRTSGTWRASFPERLPREMRLNPSLLLQNCRHGLWGVFYTHSSVLAALFSANSQAGSLAIICRFFDSNRLEISCLAHYTSSILF